MTPGELIPARVAELSMEGDLDAQIKRGVVLNRAALRKLRNRLAEAGPAYALIHAQLQRLVEMRAWHKLALSGPSLSSVLRYGFEVGKIS